MNRTEMVKILGYVKEALSTQDIIPIYSYFAFDGDVVKAYDDMVAIQFPMEFELDCCLPGKPFYDYLTALSCKEIDVEITKDETVIVKGGRSRVTLPYEPVSNFSFKPAKFKGAVEIEMNEDFIDGLKACSLSISDDPTYIYTTGISLCEDKEEGLLMFSTDLKTFSRYVPDTAFLSGSMKGYRVLPNNFCKILKQIGKDYAPEKLLISEHSAKAIFEGDIQVFTKLLDPTDVPDFKGTYKERTENSLGLYTIPQIMEKLIERANVVFGSNILEKLIKVQISEDKLTFIANSTYGEFKETIKVEGITTDDLSGSDIDECLLSLDLLKKGVAECDSFCFLEDNIMMVNGEDEEYTYLVAYSEGD